MKEQERNYSILLFKMQIRIHPIVYGLFSVYTRPYCNINLPMEKMHINERGSHTTVIEGSKDILKLLKKSGVEVSPGVIEANVKAKGKSVKLKKLNNETFEMVVVVNSSKQTFKVYGADQERITSVIQGFKADSWNVQDTMDLSDAD